MTIRKLLLAAGSLTLFPLAASTQATAATAPVTSAQATGSISGRVQNVATGQYLKNARVSVKGSSNTVFTDGCNWK